MWSLEDIFYTDVVVYVRYMQEKKKVQKYLDKHCTSG